MSHRLLTTETQLQSHVSPGGRGLFVVNKVSPGQVFLRVMRFYPVSTIAPVLHTNIFQSAAIDPWASGAAVR